MAAYRTAARLFPGCYYANLCIGMEYLRTNNTQQARISFEDALKIYENDPNIHNELGVVLYKMGSFEDAKNKFMKALDITNDEYSQIYETICKNLGHGYRKLK